MQISNLSSDSRAHGRAWRDDLSERLLILAAEVIRVVSKYPRYNPGQVISNQVMRSISSCGANYEEARGAESRADFVHKLQIVHKELRESIYWLKLSERIGIGNNSVLGKLIFDATGLSNIVAKSIVTAKGLGQR